MSDRDVLAEVEAIANEYSAAWRNRGLLNERSPASVEDKKRETALRAAATRCREAEALVERSAYLKIELFGIAQVLEGLNKKEYDLLKQRHGVKLLLAEHDRLKAHDDFLQTKLADEEGMFAAMLEHHKMAEAECARLRAELGNEAIGHLEAQHRAAVEGTRLQAECEQLKAKNAQANELLRATAVSNKVFGRMEDDLAELKAENARLTKEVEERKGEASIRGAWLINAELNVLHEQDIEVAARRGWNAGVYAASNGDRIDGSDDVEDFVSRYRAERAKENTDG